MLILPDMLISMSGRRTKREEVSKEEHSGRGSRKMKNKGGGGGRGRGK